MPGIFPSSASQDREKVKKYIKEIGNDPTIVDEIAKNKDLPTKLFGQLFHLIRNLKPDVRKELTQPWELLVLSGFEEAFLKAKTLYHIDKNSQTTGYCGLNALHLAALSDAPSQLDKALEMGIPLDSRAKNGHNVLDYAALSGNVEMIEKVLQLEQKQGIKLKSGNPEIANVLMLAAYSGKKPAVEKIETLANDKNRGIDVNAVYNDFNVANFAMESNNQQVINHFKNKNIHADLTTQDKFNYLTLATKDTPQPTISSNRNT